VPPVPASELRVWQQWGDTDPFGTDSDAPEGPDDQAPTCYLEHVRRGIVTSGDAGTGPHAALNVCDRGDCIREAVAWCQSVTGQPAQHRPDPKPEPRPSLFPQWEAAHPPTDPRAGGPGAPTPTPAHDPHPKP
jgi:hypothetical protein